jgi:hypothetical protein
MAHFVKINSPMPSPEEIASDFGVKQSRLNALLALVERTAQSRDSRGSKQVSAKKVAPKKTLANRKVGKSARAAR